jgi:hypothetical protein
MKAISCNRLFFAVSREALCSSLQGTKQSLPISKTASFLAVTFAAKIKAPLGVWGRNIKCINL